MSILLACVLLSIGASLGVLLALFLLGVRERSAVEFWEATIKELSNENARSLFAVQHLKEDNQRLRRDNQRLLDGLKRADEAARERNT